MSSINSVNSSTHSMMSGMQRMQRPDPSKMADSLFSKLDTSGKGYLEKSDFQSAFAQMSSTGSSSSSSSAASVDDVFKSLDNDSDGKITKDEMTSGLQKIADQLDSQFNKMREGGMQGAGGMPPPPPPPDGADSAGLTKDELTSKAKEASSSDSTLSSMLSTLAANFDKADTDEDGKVSAKEAMAYDQAHPSSSSTSASSSVHSSASNSSNASSTGDSGKLDTQIMKQIMELMRAYGGSGGDSGGDSGISGLLSTISTSA